MHKSTLLLSSIIAFLSFSCGTEEKSVSSTVGMVSSAHPLPHGIRIFRNDQGEINRFEGSADPRGEGTANSLSNKNNQ